MNETFPTSPLWDQLPFYPQTTCGFENPQTSFSPNFTTTSAVIPVTQQTVLSPDISSSTGNSGGERSPKPSTAAKPARRRSRPSRKTPTTLVSTSISDFRAVVQQYTGCRRRTSPTSFKNRRGPVILCFEQPPTDDRNLSPEDSNRRCFSGQDRYHQEQELEYPNAHQFHDNDHSSSMLSVDDYVYW